MKTSFRVLTALMALLFALPAVRAAEEQPEPTYAEVAPSTPQEPAPAAAPEAVPPGQWVYTEQYGWIWMPYAERYTWYPADGYGSPYMFVYYPSYGWSWVVAPWVWGWGPWPYFGVHGAAAFAWYGWGWWRTPRHWRFVPPHRQYPYRVVPAPGRPLPAPAPRGGVAPAPRGSVPAPRAAPAPSPGAAPGVAPAPSRVAPAPSRVAPAPRAAPSGGAPAPSGGAPPAVPAPRQ